MCTGTGVFVCMFVCLCVFLSKCASMCECLTYVHVWVNGTSIFIYV